ncbi:queuosine precursor transporter [Duncaniella dubosii]|uniref:queuosine precursor transporter n=1 Tax=Duncaniella dubosii TaxID=2518971 RepID=UPI000F519CBD|nr:queuosine precursor transporter [Duncaniella dubosii]MCX4285021.1 queuosine precursor transporter [Duncaniella dubosii]ROS83750.1 VUT family protein [Muribaculaceae bacterium Isolate-036 (Harlan)]
MKKNNSNLISLNAVFIVCLIIANVVTAKVIDTGLFIGSTPILIPGAALTYALTFLCTDVIGEIWGKKEANKAVWRGFAAQFLALFLICLTSMLPAHDEAMQTAYERLLGQTPIFVIGSLVAYLCSQKWDVWIFHKIRNRFFADPRRRWIWNNASTLTSQIIDTAIYITIAFGIGLGWLWQEGGVALTLGMIAGQYLLKAALALLDTPIFYLLTNKRKRECITSQNG